MQTNDSNYIQGLLRRRDADDAVYDSYVDRARTPRDRSRRLKHVALELSRRNRRLVRDVLDMIQEISEVVDGLEQYMDDLKAAEQEARAYAARRPDNEACMRELAGLRTAKADLEDIVLRVSTLWQNTLSPQYTDAVRRLKTAVGKVEPSADEIYNKVEALKTRIQSLGQRTSTTGSRARSRKAKTRKPSSGTFS